LTSDRFFIDKKKLESRFAYLEGEEHHHLSRVARIKPKDKVWLFDEQGMTYLARVEEIEREKTRLFILKKEKVEEVKVKITLAQALLRSKKMEFIIQKATEWGITTFIPVMTSRSLARIEEKIGKKIDRWQKIAREASKQSRRAFFPSISIPMPLDLLLEERREEQKILESDFEAISLGNQVLRAETAALSSIALIAHFWNL